MRNIRVHDSYTEAYKCFLAIQVRTCVCFSTRTEKYQSASLKQATYNSEFKKMSEYLYKKSNWI